MKEMLIVKCWWFKHLVHKYEWSLYIYGLNCKSQPGKYTTHKKLQAYTFYECRYKKLCHDICK